MQHCAVGSHSPWCSRLHGVHGTYGGPPLPSTPVPHQFHQHCLWLKKHVSSYDICCVCFFMTVTVGYVMVVLLSCLIYLVLLPLWSITTVMICTYPQPGEAERCPGMQAHMLHRPGYRMQKPIPLSAHSPGASTTHECPLHRGAQCSPCLAHLCLFVPDSLLQHHDDPPRHCLPEPD